MNPSESQPNTVIIRCTTVAYSHLYLHQVACNAVGLQTEHQTAQWSLVEGTGNPDLSIQLLPEITQKIVAILLYNPASDIGIMGLLGGNEVQTAVITSWIPIIHLAKTEEKITSSAPARSLPILKTNPEQLAQYLLGLRTGK